MSLVNDMLRDLDRRKRGAGGAAPRVSPVRAWGEGEAGARSYFLAALALAGVLLGAAGGFLYFRADAPLPESAAVPQAVPAAVASVPVPAAAAPAPPMPAEVVEVIAEGTRAGFTITVEVSDDLNYSVTSRNSYGLNLLLPEAVFADDFSPRGLDAVAGLSIYPVADGLNLNLELDGDAEFEVFDRSRASGMQIVIEARFPSPPPTPAEISFQPPGPALIEAAAPLSQSAAAPAPAAQDSPPPAVPETGTPAAPASPPEAVMTAREPSFAELDRTTSQAGIRLAQRGQLMEAYAGLLAFVEANAGAHQSREALATILLAQLEYQQAETVLRQGLSLAPHYAPYKKLQARLFLNRGQVGEALALLKERPPELADDREYHDLLASLYQQAGDHEMAVMSFRSLLNSYAGEARWWVGLAISLEAQSQVAEALSAYQQALQLGGLSPEIQQYSQGRVRSLRRQP